MIRNVLLVLIFLPLINLHAQECTYKEYYDLTALATKNYHMKKYKLSREQFKDAFAKVTFPLGSDLGTALQVAKKTSDEEWAEAISIQLAKGGIPIRFFNDLKRFSWYGKFAKDFSAYSKFYNENFNVTLKEKLLPWPKKIKSLIKNFTNGVSTTLN